MDTLLSASLLPAALSRSVAGSCVLGAQAQVSFIILTGGVRSCFLQPLGVGSGWEMPGSRSSQPPRAQPRLAEVQASST